MLCDFHLGPSQTGSNPFKKSSLLQVNLTFFQVLEIMIYDLEATENFQDPGINSKTQLRKML